jgi:hypothetical protein
VLVRRSMRGLRFTSKKVLFQFQQRRFEHDSEG